MYHQFEQKSVSGYEKWILLTVHMHFLGEE